MFDAERRERHSQIEFGNEQRAITSNRSHLLSISIDPFLAEFKQIAQEKGVIF